MRINLLNKILIGFFLCVSCSPLKKLELSQDIKVLNEKLLDSLLAHKINSQWMKLEEMQT